MRQIFFASYDRMLVSKPGKVVLQMISTYIRQGQHTLRRWAVDPVVHTVGWGAAHVLAGFCLSAASVSQGMLPLVMGLVWACRGWRAVLVAAGGALGYGVFWGALSMQALVWTGLALAGVLILGDRRVSREMPLLIPAIGMLMVSAVGLGFQLLAEDTTTVPLYLVRVALGGAAPWVFTGWLQRRETVIQWLGWGLLALGLAQIAPVAWLGLGFVAAGFAAAGSPFLGAAVVGLAVDLAGITAIPITAVTVLGFLTRLIPRIPRWIKAMAPAGMGVILMYVCGRWDLMVLPGLLLGGLAGSLLLPGSKIVPRRGQTGVAQVKLELAAELFAQTRQILEESAERVVDRDALVQRAAEEACAGCAARSSCRDSRKLCQLKGDLLQKPLLTIRELPLQCKKASRVLARLRQAQEQLRTLQADHQRQQEYRQAVIQQYGFVESFLHRLSDDLSERKGVAAPAFDPVVMVFGNRGDLKNGDRCMDFAGTGNHYYIILCDGMGTGPGAVQEGQRAGTMLRKLLSCGFPPEHALRSLNSLCALRDRAGAVTVDLAQIALDTGHVTLYKWGAAPSYLITREGVKKLGSVSPPPGLSVTQGQEVRCSLTLRKGQTLLLASDGVREEQVLETGKEPLSPAALAGILLKNTQTQDDATIVTVQLNGVSSGNPEVDRLFAI